MITIAPVKPKLTLEEFLRLLANKVIKKIMFCLQAGTQLAWLIDPKDESVVIFRPNLFPEVRSEDEIRPVLEQLPDFQLPVSEMFNWLRVD